MGTTPRNIVTPPRPIAFRHVALGREHWAPRFWGTWLVLLLLLILALLPLPISRAVGASLGMLMFGINAKRRRIARVNLRLCFPEMAEHDRARLLHRHFRVYGQSFTDLGLLVWASRARLRRLTRYRGLEIYRDLLARGRRVILLVPHCVGINFGGPLLATEHPMFCIVKPLRNPVFDWFIQRARLRFGGAVLARAQGLRPAILALKAGHTFHYSADEDLGPKNSVFAPFFGVPAATLPTLGRIAALTDAVVVPCFTWLRPWGRGYEVVLYPPLEGFPARDETADAVQMNRAIEIGVRARPDQYFWTFKLFKTRPDAAPSPYDRRD